MFEAPKRCSGVAGAHPAEVSLGKSRWHAAAAVMLVLLRNSTHRCLTLSWSPLASQAVQGRRAAAIACCWRQDRRVALPADSQAVPLSDRCAGRLQCCRCHCHPCAPPVSALAFAQHPRVSRTT